jgi:serine phosphatase RsbU (regulator of sigma subunit)
MRPIHMSDRRFQASLILTVAVLLVMLGVTFYDFSSMPTDENIFMDLPSTLSVARPFPATTLGWRSFQQQGGFSAPLSTDDSVKANDLLLSIGSMQVRTREILTRTLAGLKTDTATIVVLRPSEFRTIRWVVKARDLAENVFVDSPRSVIVTDVTRGGASDRAGMKLGDFILRINGRGFSTASEADRVMRSGMSGESNTYEILRNGTPLTLNVVLARFGFSLMAISFFLAGIVFVALGTFLGLKRPGFFSVRMMALWMVSLGFFIAVLTIRREPEVTPFVIAREVLAVLGGYLGMVLLFHSELYFPWQRPFTKARRWILAAMYLLAIVSPVLLIFHTAYFAYILIAAIWMMGMFVCPPFTQGATPQQRSIGRPIRIVRFLSLGGTIAYVVITGTLGLGSWQGLGGVFLVFLPLTYLYTIGHYRLFDLDLAVRRNVQYSLFSGLWWGVVATFVVWAFMTIPATPLLLPNVVINGLSFEIRRELPTPQEQLIAQRAIAMLLGVGVWFVFARIRRVGQRLLDRKYHRTQFDYGHAAGTITDVLASRLSMSDIASGLVTSLVDLVKLRGSAIVVFRNGDSCCCDAVAGVPAAEWKRFVNGLDKGFIESLKHVTVALPVDHLPKDLNGPLVAMRFESIVPVVSKGTLVGAIIVGEKLSESPLSSEDLSFLADVAQQVAVSIENAFLYENVAEQDRMRHELAIARQIQLSSLPSTTPAVAGLDVSGSSTPAMEVGGDFFDYLDGNGTDLMVVVGDVSGKGTSAALYMSKVQGILRSLHQFGLSPQELFLRANRLLCADMQKNSFITASAALFLPEKKEVRLVRAGHLPVYAYRFATGNVERVIPRGLGLGLSDSGVFAEELEERAQHYDRGDVLVFVTDGVTEARNAAGDEYGEERLSKIIAEASAQPAEVIHEKVMADLLTFGGDEPPHDDQTIVVVRIS